MNPWLLVGFLLNAALGIMALNVESFSLFSGSPGFAKLFVPLKASGLVQAGMALWFLALFLSFVGVVLVTMKRTKAGARLALVGGAFFFPIGLIQCKGALMLLDAAKEAALQEQLGPSFVSNNALETTLSRRLWVILFDLGFGLLLALASVGLVVYANFQHFFRRLPADVPKDVFTQVKAGALSKSYLMLGILMLLSLYVAALLWAALAAQLSVGAAWKVLSLAFFSGPTSVLAFAFGMCLFLIGVSALRRPILQLHEHYFTIRPHFFSSRLYSLYKDIREIEQEGEHKVLLHLPVKGKDTTVSLPMKLANERQRKHLLSTIEKRREAQRRKVFV